MTQSINRVTPTDAVYPNPNPNWYADYLASSEQDDWYTGTGNYVAAVMVSIILRSLVHQFIRKSIT
jgi:hypothetical protein